MFEIGKVCPFIHVFIYLNFILFYCTSQTDKAGCATFTLKMSTFTKLDQKVLMDELDLKATVEEEGTGKLYNI